MTKSKFKIGDVVFVNEEGCYFDLPNPCLAVVIGVYDSEFANVVVRPMLQNGEYNETGYWQCEKDLEFLTNVEQEA